MSGSRVHKSLEKQQAMANVGVSKLHEDVPGTKSKGNKVREVGLQGDKIYWEKRQIWSKHEISLHVPSGQFS